MNNKMFDMVNDPGFDGWKPISDDELFNSTNAQNPNPQPGQQPPPQPGQPGQPAPPIGGGFNMGTFINARVAVELTDTLGSAAGVISAKMLTGKKLLRSKFKASEDEKKQLEVPMNAALAQANIRITNPWEALFWGFVSIYGSKVAIEVIDDKLTDKDDDDKPRRGRKSAPEKTGGRDYAAEYERRKNRK